MSLEGRTEKRVSISVPLYLRPAGDALPAERTATVNLSSRGAQVLSRRRWQPEAEPRVVSRAGNPLLQTRVVYCHALGPEYFCVGLQFRASFNNWREALG